MDDYEVYTQGICGFVLDSVNYSELRLRSFISLDVPTTERIFLYQEMRYVTRVWKCSVRVQLCSKRMQLHIVVE